MQRARPWSVPLEPGLLNDFPCPRLLAAISGADSALAPDSRPERSTYCGAFNASSTFIIGPHCAFMWTKRATGRNPWTLSISWGVIIASPGAASRVPPISKTLSDRAEPGPFNLQVHDYQKVNGLVNSSNITPCRKKWQMPRNRTVMGHASQCPTVQGFCSRFLETAPVSVRPPEIGSSREPVPRNGGRRCITTNAVAPPGGF
jgi:hypothetical protein